MLKFLKNREVNNASWLIGGKMLQMFLSVVVSILSARILGPAHYGLVNYGLAYTNFFMSLCTLGINSIIVKDFVKYPEEKGTAIGSTIVLRLISSGLSVILIILTSCFIDHDPLTVSIVALCAISLLFHAFDIINYYFQSLYQSRITAIATLVAYMATSVYKIILLLNGANLKMFALASSVDYCVLSGFLLMAYKVNRGPKLHFSFRKGKALLKESYHYIISGAMVAIYAQVDKLMLKGMVDEEAVGYYSIATSISGMWVFIVTAIIDSMYPTILQLYQQDQKAFCKKNRQLYAIVFYISALVSVLFTLFGKYAIQILYGDEYLPSYTPLAIVTWYTAFSYLGVARNAWIVCNGMQKYLKYMYLSAVIINIGLNSLMIPQWGASGAALASLITQILTSLVIPAMIPKMRPNVKLMVDAILLNNVK